MAITKEKKETIVGKLKDISRGAKSLVFVNFNKVPVMLVTDMRKKLRQEGVGYFVAKKTLIRRALSEAGYTGEMPTLPGEVAVAYGEDPLVPSKSIYAYQKTNPDQFMIVGGVYEGAYVDGEYMISIAKIPGREALLGQLAYMFNWPLTSLAIATSELAKKKGEGQPVAEVKTEAPVEEAPVATETVPEVPPVTEEVPNEAVTEATDENPVV